MKLGALFFLDFFMVLATFFALFGAGLGIWWFVYFRRPEIRAQFASAQGLSTSADSQGRHLPRYGIFVASLMALIAVTLGLFFATSKNDHPASTATDAPPDLEVTVDGELMWTRTDNGKDIEWEEANAYCSVLTLEGLKGWRLPALDELAKLYEVGNAHNIREPFRLTNWWVWSSTK